MNIFQPLKHRRLAFLWGGQVFSSIGDELYAVALVWMSAELIGTNAGYIMPLQSASILTFSLFGGVWADRWDHRKTMIVSDIIRGMTLLLLPLASGSSSSIQLWILVFVTVVVSSLKVFFDPALRASLPRLAGNIDLLHSTNALMETTSRFAKIIGPGFVGILSRYIPVIYYFTKDYLPAPERFAVHGKNHLSLGGFEGENSALKRRGVSLHQIPKIGFPA